MVARHQSWYALWLKKFYRQFGVIVSFFAMLLRFQRHNGYNNINYKSKGGCVIVACCKGH
jgi:hypothetical protein